MVKYSLGICMCSQQPSALPIKACSCRGLLPAASLGETAPSLLSPLQGGVKVLITGPWQEASNNYSCLFDQISVPASLIQPGVLRCYCPGEAAVPSPAGVGEEGGQ